MSAPRFHCARTFAAGERGALPGDVFHHATRVRRLRSGDTIVLFAGDGTEAEARLVDVGRNGATMEIVRVQRSDRESPLRVTLVQGISTGDRMDYTLQKAVELGVTTIMPVFAERTVVRLAGERADKRRAHWQEIVVSACEQCGRNRIPEVTAATGLLETLERLRGGDATRLVLSTTGGRRLSAIDRPATAIVLLAGPEGGLTDVEECDAKRAGFELVSLGPRVLRTETAAVAALAAMQALWGDG